jgi:hypothetical protein
LDGITKLINLMRITDAGILSICMTSLAYTLVYASGVTYLEQRPQIFLKLYELLSF